MTTPHPPETIDRADDLKQRYLQASGEQNLLPGNHVRRAAMAHAQMVAAGVKAPAPMRAAEPAAAALQVKQGAANKWNFSLVASAAIAGMTALLALQFDRSEPQDQAVVIRIPSPTARPISPSTSPSIPPSISPPANVQLQPDSQLKSSEASATSAKQLTPTDKSVVPAPNRVSVGSSAGSPSRQAELQANQVAKENVSSLDALARPASAAAESLRKAEPAPETASSARTAQAAPPAAPLRSLPPTNAEMNVQTPSRPDAAQAAVPTAAIKSRPTAAAAPALVEGDSGQALRAAAESGQIAALETMLQQASPAQLDARDGKGRTALMLAAKGGHAGVVQRLLSAGADVSLKDSAGQTAAQIAQDLGHTHITNLLAKQPSAP